jgi:hypothetical protein
MCYYYFYLNLVDDSNGRLLSASSDPILNPGLGLVVVETEGRDGLWADDTHPTDPRTYIAVVLHRVVPLKDFIFRFEDSEREDFFEATKTIKKAAAFKETLTIIQEVDLDSAFVIDGVTAMETIGVIGAGRAAVILSE